MMELPRQEKKHLPGHDAWAQRGGEKNPYRHESDGSPHIAAAALPAEAAKSRVREQAGSRGDMD